MADKDQIRKHLSMSSNVDLNVANQAKGSEAKKMRIMEHIKKSKDQRTL
ncbi:hypothetical protein IQ241_11345 [Romeria aff. gracilis LEGE 07310]|uniref:Uncharacterized protein n=1 Tax=Vasconcelosia minhoensis LEGE 07310 TaxID=915328 RepID=A0A8J7APK3_9CYAN|nr:hypothetical protein [Romeria gracilis]MBE9077881.1 hypothetical protein [Romeria aff. gracilis LEGE 07310]